MAKEIDAITKFYDYLLWMIPKLERFPRSQKFILADRIEKLMLDILDLLIEAAYTQNKRALLRSANLKLEKLRYLVRISKDLKLINMKSYEFSARAVDCIGKSIGGWLKYIQSWIGHVCHADSYHLRSRLFGGVAFQRGEARGAPGRFVEQQPEQRPLC